MIVSSGSRRIRATAASPAARRSASICSPTVALTPGMASVRSGPISAEAIVAARTRKPTAERGEANQCRTSLRHRQHRLPADQRLAQDRGEEPRRGQVRLAGADADRRQPDADAVDEAAPAVVGQQQLVDRLLGAVAGPRGGGEVVRDRIGQRGAVDRYRGREHQPRGVAVGKVGASDRLQQPAGAVEVHPVSLVEVRLRLAGHHRGQMEDHLRPAGHQVRRGPPLRQIDRHSIDAPAPAVREPPARRRRTG